MTDIEVIRETLGVDDEDAAIIRQLCDWVEHEVAIAEHGFPKDNVMPRQMTERLADPEYVARLLRAARDDDAPASAVEAIADHHAIIAP